MLFGYVFLLLTIYYCNSNLTEGNFLPFHFSRLISIAFEFSFSFCFFSEGRIKARGRGNGKEGITEIKTNLGAREMRELVHKKEAENMRNWINKLWS